MGITDLHKGGDELVPSDAWRALKPRQRKWIDAYLELGTYNAADKKIGWGNGSGKRHMEKNPVMRAGYDVRRRAWEKLGLIGVQKTRSEIESIAYAQIDASEITVDHKLNALDKLAKIDGQFVSRVQVSGHITLAELVASSFEPAIDAKFEDVPQVEQKTGG